MDQLDLQFVGLSIDNPVGDATAFRKTRDRPHDGEIAAKFLAAVLKLPQVRKLLFSEHFSVEDFCTQGWRRHAVDIGRLAQCRARIPCATRQRNVIA
jgi:hypothetical protein